MYEAELFEKVKMYLIHKYNCHTILLYGSYCSGDYTNESDIDIVCFSDKVNDSNNVELFEGKQLDVWVYNTEKMHNPELFLHVHKGNILLNKKGFANKFLLDIENLYNYGPKKLSNEEKDFLKAWLKKMFLRSNNGEIDGCYRYHWMLKDSLEIYFSLRGLWFLGPKKAFKWLLVNDGVAYILFNKALAQNAKKSDIEELIKYLNSL